MLPMVIWWYSRRAQFGLPGDDSNQARTSVIQSVLMATQFTLPDIDDGLQKPASIPQPTVIPKLENRRSCGGSRSLVGVPQGTGRESGHLTGLSTAHGSNFAKHPAGRLGLRDFRG
ncbi:hypothetical protein M758_5G081600 [Ceratodon purpureus]|nr:hypothetical protein M758_5G081600 [Ceratodon purpureus]